MPEPIAGTLDLSEREVYQAIKATITVHVKRDWRVRIGIRVVKFGFRMMGLSYESKVIDEIDEIVHKIGNNDEHT